MVRWCTEEVFLSSFPIKKLGICPRKLLFVPADPEELPLADYRLSSVFWLWALRKEQIFGCCHQCRFQGLEYRKAEMGRSLWRSSSPTCSNRVSLSRLFGAMSSLVLDFCKMETPQPHWMIFPVFSCSQSEQPWILFELYGVSHISICSHGISSFLYPALKTEKTLVPPSLHYPIRYLYTLKWSPSEPSLLPAE